MIQVEKKQMINAIYIIYDGICLFSRQYNEKYIKKDHILSTFLTAVNQVVQELTHKSLERLILEDDIFSFSIIDNILFVYTHNDLKDSDLEKISRNVSSKFLELYGNELKNWNGEISIFNNFKDEADKIIEMRGKSTMIKMENFLQKKKIRKIREQKKKQLKLINNNHLEDNPHQEKNLY